MTTILSKIETFKLMTMSPKYADAEIEALFLELEAMSSDDINKIMDVLEEYRPRVKVEVERKYLGSGPWLN